MPEQAWAPTPAPARAARSNASSITQVVVPSTKARPNAIYRQSTQKLRVSIPAFEIPATGAGEGKRAVKAPGPVNIERIGTPEPVPQSWSGVSSQFLSTNFDDNGTYTGGFRFIPPDSHAAAGPNHLVNVVNATISFYQKNGTLDFRDSMQAFFSSLTPLTFTFDPRVLYDQYEGRWVVMALEQTEKPDDPRNISRVFVAVSDDSDPNGTWYLSEFNSKVRIGNRRYWADYSGLAVDGQAIYITANLFHFGNGNYGGSRVWVLDKGVGTGGFYDGGTLALSELDPYAGAGIALNLQVSHVPSHMYGTTPAGLGTFLVGFSGLNDGTNEYIEVVRLDDPLGTPVFTLTYALIGDIDDVVGALPGTPQSGTAMLIDSNDRRTLDAVWQNGALWLTTTINPNSGVDTGQVTATWVKIDTRVHPEVVADFGTIGGEDIAPGTFTTFPSIAINANEDVVVGFSASAPSIFAGAYLVNRQISDPPGSMGSSVVVKAGVDWYVRTFGGTRNRWGDYSSTAVDPVDGCFWVYNQWADTRGTPISGEDGRWGTAYVKTCPSSPCSGTYNIPANTWTRFALPCSAAPSNTVADVFNDPYLGGLAPVDYNVTWIVYTRDAATPAYVGLNIGDAMTEGTGYWVYSATGTQVSLNGLPAATSDISLVGVPTTGRDNYVGHNQNVTVNWNLVKVVDGNNVLDFGQFDPLQGGSYACDAPVQSNCVMSRKMYKWNGGAYQVFDGNVLTGTVGTLDPFDAVWVQAFKPGIKLHIPVGAPPIVAATPLVPGVQSVATTEGGRDKKKKKKHQRSSWYIRLVATGGGLQDPGNVLGQLRTAQEGNDSHDLEEPAPFGRKYLSIVFTNPLFDDASWGYTTDFRPLTKQPGGVWPFVVRAWADIREVTLRWEGADELFDKAWLVDEQSGAMMKVQAGGSYTFAIEGGEHRFSFVLYDGFGQDDDSDSNNSGPRNARPDSPRPDSFRSDSSGSDSYGADQ